MCIRDRPQARRPALAARIRVVAAFDERDQRELARQAGLAHFVEHVAEQGERDFILVGKVLRSPRICLLYTSRCV